MKTDTHTVIAEMVDIKTGKRLFADDTFTPHDEDQADRLTRAGCLREGVVAKSAKADDDGDGLDGMKLDELKALAVAEEIDLGEASKKADIVAVIRAARTAA